MWYNIILLYLDLYLEKYPDTQYKDEVETLLIDSYITSKNYKEALELLKNKKSFESKVAYQKVAFYRGLELYNEGNYQDAKDLFEKSLSEQQDQTFTARATFWNAETDYNLSDYNEALIGFLFLFATSKKYSSSKGNHSTFLPSSSLFKKLGLFMPPAPQ